MPDSAAAPQPSGRNIPWATLVAAISLVLATYVAVQLVLALQKILTWLVVAGFFAIVLNPAVDFLVHRAKLRRMLAAILVFVIGFGVLGGLLYAFITPIVNETTKFANDFPRYVTDARAGKGEVGKLVKRYNIDTWVDQNQGQLKDALQNSGKQALSIARRVGDTAAALATILVLTWLMLVEGPRTLAAAMGLVSPPRAERLKRVGRNCARAMTGYMAGNLLISLIAGLVTYSGLWAFGVPFRAVMALWVGFADLIPLVGAMLGAIPTVLVALLHSPTAAIGMVVIYVVYQQFENHVLQVGIMSRTVRLSPLAVLVSLLIGVQLFGLLGALLAIPVGGVVQVIAKELYEWRQQVKASAAEAAAAATGDGATGAKGPVGPPEPPEATVEQVLETLQPPDAEDAPPSAADVDGHGRRDESRTADDGAAEEPAAEPVEAEAR